MGSDATPMITMVTSNSAPTMFHAIASARGAFPVASKMATTTAAAPATMSKL
jgi:hypothetical protein